MGITSGSTKGIRRAGKEVEQQGRGPAPQQVPDGRTQHATAAPQHPWLWGGQGSHRHVTGLLGCSHLLKVCGFPHPTPSPPRVLGNSSSTSTTGTPGKSPSRPLLQWVSHTHHSDLESRPTLVLPGCSWPARGRTFLTGTVSSGWHQEVLSPEPTQQWEQHTPCPAAM